MALTIPLSFSLAPFPTGQAVDANQYGQQLVANLQASFSANLLQGQTGGSMPSSNIGPYFDGTIWWAWNPALNAYVPVHEPASRNVVRNGNMQIAQRQTFFANPGNVVYTLDGYRVDHNLTTATGNVGQLNQPVLGTSNYPTGIYTFELTPVITQNTIGSGEYWVVSQAIERQFARPLFGNPTSLSVMLQSSTAGTYCVTLRNNGATWSYVTECTVTANSPKWFTIQNIPAFPTTTGNWGTAETDPCYRIFVCATSGSGFQTTTPGIWVNSNVFATPNQTNLFATAGGNYLLIGYLKHQSGIVCTPFEAVPFDQDLRACQRYYSQSYAYGTYPGTISQTNEVYYYSPAGAYAFGSGRFPVPMRIAPTVTIYNPITGVINTTQTYPAATNIPITSVEVGDAILSYINGSTLPASNSCRFHYTASADL